MTASTTDVASSPALDFIAKTVADNAARRRAEELVGVHRGCDTVEVWRGATRLFDVTTAQRAAA